MAARCSLTQALRNGVDRPDHALCDDPGGVPTRRATANPLTAAR